MLPRYPIVSCLLAAALAGWLPAESARGQLIEPPPRMLAMQEVVPPGELTPPTTGEVDPIWRLDRPLGELPTLVYEEPWTWQSLPDGIIYRNYLASTNESRISGVVSHVNQLGWVWDITIGGRVGLLRYGTSDAERPHGWQLDIEGASFPRLDVDHDMDLLEADFRFGVPLSYSNGPWQAKLAYYHVSSHVGDELLVRDPTVTRINYVRDVALLGVARFLGENVRVYGEAGYAFYRKGGAEPWEVQTGIEFSPRYTHPSRGAPFAAINGRLRQEVDWGGNVVAQLGWQWRGVDSGRLWRIGAQYFNGKTDQYEFFRESEQQYGFGLWFDY